MLIKIHVLSLVFCLNPRTCQVPKPRKIDKGIKVEVVVVAWSDVYTQVIVWMSVGSVIIIHGINGDVIELHALYVWT